MDQLQVRVGIASETGRRNANEDFCAARESDSTRATREATVVVADGLGGGPGGRLAAETTVRGFLNGYFELPETLGADRAAAKVLAAMNRWVYAQGRQDPNLRGMATTFTALLLRGRGAHVVHVGDCRIYRLRDGGLQCLTQDHVHGQPDMRHVLYRAIGLEQDVRADYARHELRMHDRFLLCSDGVHGVLRDADIAALLAARGAPDEDANRLVTHALSAGSQDNVTAAVIDVIGVPAADRSDLEIEASNLPVLPLPKIGDVVDGFQLLAIVAEGRYSRLYHAKDTVDGSEVILKFPHPRLLGEAVARRSFVRESWIAQQVKSPYVVEPRTLAEGRQTRLYAIMSYYRGETLEARLLRAPRISLAQGVDVGVKLGRAVYALNRLRIIHRDIKPENVLLSETPTRLKLLDLGVARLPGADEVPDEEVPGTPSYMAPEMLQGALGDERSEVYALGVTLYRMFSAGHYPYGEVEAFSNPRFGRRMSLSRYRPDLPAWLDASIARAVAAKPEDRYGDVLEFAFDLERNLAHGGASVVPRKTSIYERDPLRFWQVVALLLLLALIASLIAR